MKQFKSFGFMPFIAATLFLGILRAGAVELPENQANWINSPPITLQSLEGKAAFLWFYEET